jgi:hypothetical protein
MAHRQIKGQRKGLNIFSIGNKEYYKLYDTVIVIAEHLEDGSYRIRLNHNGFKTNHTKNCMNDFLRRFGFKVYQKDFFGMLEVESCLLSLKLTWSTLLHIQTMTALS